MSGVSPRSIQSNSFCLGTRTTYTMFPFIGCVTICGLIFVGAVSQTFTFMSIGLVICIAVCITFAVLQQPNYEICNGILLLLCSQNICIGLGAHLGNNSSSSLSYLTQIPFATVFILWLGIVGKDFFLKKRLSITEKLFICLLICICFSLFVGHGNFQTIAITIRNLTVFYMAFEIGKHCLRTNQDFKRFMRFLVSISIFMVLVGEILIIGGYPLHNALGVHEVYVAKGSPFPEGTLDYRFYTTLIDTQYFRMGSFYFEPINLAYLLSAAFLVSLTAPIYKDSLTRLFATIVLAIGLMQTVGKGGYLLTACVLACLAVEYLNSTLTGRIPNWRTKRKIIFGIAACAIIAMILYVKYIGAAVMPHIWGITETWSNVLKKPWGYGLGTGGNAAQILDANADRASWFGTGGETALMSFMYQLGIQGIIFFTVCLLSTKVSNTYNKKWMRMYCYIPFALLGVSLMQDNTFTPQCIIPFMLLLGGAKFLVKRNARY